MGRARAERATVLAVIGTRPEAIKVAPLALAAADDGATPLRVELALTG